MFIDYNVSVFSPTGFFRTAYNGTKTVGPRSVPRRLLRYSVIIIEPEVPIAARSFRAVFVRRWMNEEFRYTRFTVFSSPRTDVVRFPRGTRDQCPRRLCPVTSRATAAVFNDDDGLRPKYA